jgi:hypothetical protein
MEYKNKSLGNHFWMFLDNTLVSYSRAKVQENITVTEVEIKPT